MSLARLLSTDPRPVPSPLPGFRASEWRDVAALARITGRTTDDLAARAAAGHRAFVATIDDVPTAHGWLASRTASMGELGVTLHLDAGDCYLWNFVTLPGHRGRGIYPRLLDAVLGKAFAEGVRRAWIAYAPENHASATGIRRAGFSHVADLSFDPSGAVAFRVRVPGTESDVAALLGVPTTREDLNPCWRCVRTGRVLGTCAPGTCRCDYQRPESGCASGRPGDEAPGLSISNGAGIS